MSRTIFFGALVVASFFWGTVAPAAAQEKPQAAKSTTARPGEPEVKIEPQLLSREEKRAQIEKFVIAQRQNLAQVTQLVQEARESRDMIQLNCLTDKLEQVTGLLRISEAASVSMYEAMARDNEEEVNGQYTRTALAYYKSQALTTEAKQCIGAMAVFTGNTEIQMTIDDAALGSDPTQPLPPPVGPPLPAVASGS
ncbi:MAG: hypothetical protein HC923_01415 [Myxococcales bacterium]|nr:hypothetical protein [Myxococcales bacterium]